MAKPLIAFCLAGVIASTDKGQSVAVFEPLEPLGFWSEYYGDLEPPQLAFRKIGEMYQDKLVCDIEPRRVCLKDPRGIEYYSLMDCLEQESPKIPVSEIERYDNEVYVSRAYKEYYTSGIGLAKAMMQAGSIFEEDEFGNPVGFSLWEIEPQSVYDQAGLRDGDTITSINGLELNSAGNAIEALLNLKNEEDWEISLIRNLLPMKIRVRVSN